MTGPRAPHPGRPADDPDYSATELAAHWAEGPATDGARGQDPGPGGPATGGAGPRSGPPARPDRVEGAVLRFGPGVPAPPDGAGPHTAPRTAGTAPTLVAPPAAPRPRRTGRRYVLPALVLLGVLAFLAWQRYGPQTAVRDVTVRTDGVVPARAVTADGCGGTADIVAVVRTDGRPGTLTYRWLRGDGSASGVLTERVRRGQREARLHLLWTFSGRGTYVARADVQVLTPSRHGAGTTFTYACPGGLG
ncbi:hypothetical protein [Streptomyces sp. enrichment culture]|uniref:hypothetical protein n=1 Tax=Streptomyces sp. enrichment culture TaxID=1795815 RepID=UPI003F57B961